MQPTSENGRASFDHLHIGLVSVSDRAASGVYTDQGIPALREWLNRTVQNPVRYTERLIPDERAGIAETLRELVDDLGCHLILTTGGTGPAPRDVTPEATMDIADRLMPGFGEEMRRISLHFVPTAILSRQVGAIRKSCLVLNLPGQPKSIRETLEGVRNASGNITLRGVFAAVPYCIDLIGGPYFECDPAVCDAFRPLSAQRSKG